MLSKQRLLESLIGQKVDMYYTDQGMMDIGYGGRADKLGELIADVGLDIVKFETPKGNVYYWSIDCIRMIFSFDQDDLPPATSSTKKVDTR